MTDKPYLPVNPCEGCGFKKGDNNLCPDQKPYSSCEKLETYKSNKSALITYTEWLIKELSVFLGESDRGEEIIAVEQTNLESLLKELKEASK